MLMSLLRSVGWDLHWPAAQIARRPKARGPLVLKAASWVCLKKSVSVETTRASTRIRQQTTNSSSPLASRKLITSRQFHAWCPSIGCNLQANERVASAEHQRAQARGWLSEQSLEWWSARTKTHTHTQTRTQTDGGTSVKVDNNTILRALISLRWIVVVVVVVVVGRRRRALIIEII